LCECALGLTLREEHILRIFENRVLRREGGSMAGENCVTRSFIICTLDQIL